MLLDLHISSKDYASLKRDNKYTDDMPKFEYTKVSLFENLSRKNKCLRKVISLNSEKLMTDKFKEKVSNSSELTVTVTLQKFFENFWIFLEICL